MPRTKSAAPQRHLLRAIAADLDTQDGAGFLVFCADGHEIGFPMQYLDEVIKHLRQAAGDLEAEWRRRAR